MRPPHIFGDVEDSLINSLIAARDIHFASTVIVAGIVFFDLCIAAPVLRSELRLPATEASFDSLAVKILWISLGLSVASAIAWLCLLAAQIADKSLDEAIADGTILVVLSQTRFGFTWGMRIVLAAMLAALLLLREKARAQLWRGVLVTLLAAAYLGSLAFAGHGEEGLGFERHVHLAADFLHLLAAGIWLGSLIPFAILLMYMRRLREQSWLAAACDAGVRFSSLGVLAVGILLVSGIVNTSFLIGGLQGLTDTMYGRWLLLKIGLFIAMVCLATINRQYLLPRLCRSTDHSAATHQGDTVQRLVLSAILEIVLGVGIITIVGVLGISVPPIDMAAHMH